MKRILAALATALVLVLSLASARPAPAQTAFQVEPTFQRTFVATDDLAAGDLVHLQVKAGSRPERIRLHLCGPECSTAQTICMWDTNRFANGGTIIFEIREPGLYYVWVDDLTIEHVVPRHSEQSGDELSLSYPSGLSIRAKIIKP